jgi:hypothetical protein
LLKREKGEENMTSSHVKAWKLLLSLALLISMIIVPIEEVLAGFPIGIDPITREKFRRIKILPLNIVIVEGTRLADDINGGNGPPGWLRGWKEIVGIVAEKNDIWMQAGIQFALRHVIKIPDPTPPPDGPGAMGDILDTDFDNRTEYLRLLRSANIGLINVSSFRGITEIKIRNFVDPNGTITGTLGEAFDIPPPCGPTLLKEVSREPANLPLPAHLALQRLFDDVYRGRVSRVPLWQPGVVEAHEVGHLLGLRHPPGVQMPPPDAPAPNDLLMAQTWGRKDARLTRGQIDTARDYANNHVPSLRVRDRRYGIILPARRLALSRTVDEIFEIEIPCFIDLFDVDTWIDLDTSIANFTAFTTGLSPPNITGVSYTFMMNLDDDNATGVPLELSGVDAIAEILVNKVDGVPQVSYNVTLFNPENNQSDQIIDPRIVAKIRNIVTEDSEQTGPPTPVSEVVYISIPEEILTTYVNIVEGYPMIAKTSWGDISDCSPALRVSHVIPQRALLTATSYNGAPGTVVSLHGTYFTPNASLWIMFDDIKLAETSTDPLGEFTANVTIPTNATEGDHSLWAFSPTEDANGDVVIFQVSLPVGGFIIPFDNLALLAPHISLASTIIATTVVTVIYVKRIKRRK